MKDRGLRVNLLQCIITVLTWLLACVKTTG